jgi:hypothetical protein
VPKRFGDRMSKRSIHYTMYQSHYDGQAFIFM